MIAANRAPLASLEAQFRQRFGTVATHAFAAPGRVNLIGEHTDYNDGFVMPVALAFRARVLAAPRDDGRLRLYSRALADEVMLPVPGPAAHRAAGTPHWSDYVVAVAWALAEAGARIPGADLLLDSDVPIGAGLSSSAAIEVASALALASLGRVDLTGKALAQLCQRAENAYVGTRCGIMDQFASTHGRAGHALLIDCRSLAHETLTLEPPSGGGAQIVVANTTVRHALAGGEYNRRRAECEAGVAALRAHFPAIDALRDVSSAALETVRDALEPGIYRRCRHVVGENERVQASAAALRRGDLVAFGALMRASHASLREDYEVSCPELDLLVDLASEVEGVLGARMTGGGFGGCTVNLVRPAAVGPLIARLEAGYRAATGIVPPLYVCGAAGGAGPLEGAAVAGA